MKKCPQCNAVYADEMAFCLQDGTALLTEKEETIVRQSLPLANQPVKQGVSPIFAYLTVAFLALFIGGGVVALLMWKNNSPTEQPKTANTNQISEKPKTNSSTEFSATPVPIPPLTTESVQDLINTWEKAQDTRNFSLYKSCYDAAFRGIKRTVNGNVSSYNYNQWLDDRRKMMSKAKYMEVRLDRLRISIQDNLATVEFDQYFSTSGYADFGPKVIKVKMTENGAKIIYEELKSSSLETD